MARGPARTLLDTLAYTAGLFGGLVGLVTGASRAPRWRQSTKTRRQTYALGERAGSGGFKRLRASLFGYSKEEVADTLGPPPAAAIGPAAAAASTSATLPAAGAPTSFWNANTWYYPFDPERHAAIAVLFDRNRVVRVELIGGER